VGDQGRAESTVRRSAAAKSGVGTTSPTKTRKPKPEPEPVSPDLTGFYFWIVRHPESPLNRALKRSGYFDDSVFIARTIRFYDFFQWRHFFERRGVSKDALREEWRRFVSEGWRKLGARAGP